MRDISDSVGSPTEKSSGVPRTCPAEVRLALKSRGPFYPIRLGYRDPLRPTAIQYPSIPASQYPNTPVSQYPSVSALPGISISQCSGAPRIATRDPRPSPATRDMGSAGQRIGGSADQRMSGQGISGSGYRVPVGRGRGTWALGVWRSATGEIDFRTGCQELPRRWEDGMPG
jgi:hypothetical protein